MLDCFFKNLYNIRYTLIFLIFVSQPVFSKEIPYNLNKNFWDCDYAIANTLQPIDVMEMCDMIVTDVWRNYFNRNNENFLEWYNKLKNKEHLIRKNMLNPNKQLLI